MDGGNPARRALWVPTAAVYLSAAFLLGIAVYSADDYWYSTFMDGGLGEYLHLMRVHYEEMNGRMLVHAAAQLILHCGSWLFALAGTALTLAIPWASLRAARLPAARHVACLLIFGAGLLLMPGGMLSRGFLWTSAFCNYVLPTAMVCALLPLLQRLSERGGGSLPLAAGAALFSLLCGATTEQSGFVALCLALYFCLASLARDRRALPALLVSAAACLAGLLSIFLSPATQLRLAQETGASSAASLLDAVRRGLAAQAELLIGGRTSAALLAALFLAAGLVLSRSGGSRRPLLLCSVPAAAALAMALCAGAARQALYAAALISLIPAAAALLRSRRSVCALLMLCAAASLCVMLPTNTAGERVFLPFYLYSLSAAALLGAELLASLRPRAASAALALAALAAIVLRLPLFAGCWDNYQVERLNRRYERDYRETGVLYYCMDYDMDYTHTKAFSEGYTYAYWLDSAGFDPDTGRVYLYSGSLPSVYVSGERLTSPALPGESGWLLPLRDTVEALGETVTVLDGSLEVSVSGRRFEISYPSWGRALVSWEGGSLEVELSTGYYQTCLGEAAFTEAFGLGVEERGSSIRLSPGG